MPSGSRQQDGDVECERWDGDEGMGWRTQDRGWDGDEGCRDGMQIQDAGGGKMWKANAEFGL